MQTALLILNVGACMSAAVLVLLQFSLYLSLTDSDPIECVTGLDRFTQWAAYLLKVQTLAFLCGQIDPVAASAAFLLTFPVFHRLIIVAAVLSHSFGPLLWGLPATFAILNGYFESQSVRTKYPATFQFLEYSKLQSPIAVDPKSKQP